MAAPLDTLPTATHLATDQLERLRRRPRQPRPVERRRTGPRLPNRAAWRSASPPARH